MSANDPADLKRIYEARFESTRRYRAQVWTVLISDYFQKHIAASDSVLDLGCGYGEFINQVRCGRKYAMDLNPRAPEFLDKAVTFLEQDCSLRWELPDASLNAIFTSNFFEHLPDKAALGRTLDEAKRCLAPGGRLIALGPNIKYLPGEYWEFWDHYLPLTENSLKEALMTRGFQVDLCEGKFLPYTMVDAPEYPLMFLRMYLKLKMAWRLFGKQFLVIARKP
jgi:SAM-dependent methyltransferase